VKQADVPPAPQPPPDRLGDARAAPQVLGDDRPQLAGLPGCSARLRRGRLARERQDRALGRVIAAAGFWPVFGALALKRPLGHDDGHLTSVG
jgi:hypothetical protein